MDALIFSTYRQARATLHPHLKALGIGLTEYCALLALNEVDSLSLGRLAEATHVDYPTLSRVVHTLEAKGVFAIQPDPTHGRQIQIRLTASGHQFITEQLVPLSTLAVA